MQNNPNIITTSDLKKDVIKKGRDYIANDVIYQKKIHDALAKKLPKNHSVNINTYLNNTTYLKNGNIAIKGASKKINDNLQSYQNNKRNDIESQTDSLNKLHALGARPTTIAPQEVKRRDDVEEDNMKIKLFKKPKHSHLITAVRNHRMPESNFNKEFGLEMNNNRNIRSYGKKLHDVKKNFINKGKDFISKQSTSINSINNYLSKHYHIDVISDPYLVDKSVKVSKDSKNEFVKGAPKEFNNKLRSMEDQANNDINSQVKSLKKLYNMGAISIPKNGDTISSKEYYEMSNGETPMYKMPKDSDFSREFGFKLHENGKDIQNDMKNSQLNRSKVGTNYVKEFKQLRNKTANDYFNSSTESEANDFEKMYNKGFISGDVSLDDINKMNKMEIFGATDPMKSRLDKAFNSEGISKHMALGKQRQADLSNIQQRQADFQSMENKLKELNLDTKFHHANRVSNAQSAQIHNHSAKINNQNRRTASKPSHKQNRGHGRNMNQGMNLPF